jgi:hypothetical protein
VKGILWDFAIREEKCHYVESLRQTIGVKVLNITHHSYKVKILFNEYIASVKMIKDKYPVFSIFAAN